MSPSAGNAAIEWKTDRSLSLERDRELVTQTYGTPQNKSPIEKQTRTNRSQLLNYVVDYRSKKQTQLARLSIHTLDRVYMGRLSIQTRSIRLWQATSFCPHWQPDLDPCPKTTPNEPSPSADGIAANGQQFLCRVGHFQTQSISLFLFKIVEKNKANPKMAEGRKPFFSGKHSNAGSKQRWLSLTFFTLCNRGYNLF